jgi:solute carrier family 25, member 39/40
VDPRALHGLECHVYDSSLDAARRMVRRDGLRALWRGTGVSLAHAAPSVGLYLPTYDYLQARYAELGSPLLAPALAGATARALVTLVVAPVELVRTRVQAGQAGDGRPQGLLTGLAAALGGAPAGSPRWQVLWRGAGATLARDVPFSALYWAALEPLRRALVKLEGAESGDTLAVTRANVVAGSTAGALAAALTTPLDALKTLRQVGGGGGGASALSLACACADCVLPHTHSRSALGKGTLSLLRTLNSRGQLFVGVLPRALRAAPACGIVLAAYEVLKLQ